MGASGAKYGIATSHFYWVGAIPAMVFVGIFMMPFYYGSAAIVLAYILLGGLTSAIYNEVLQFFPFSAAWQA